DVCARSWITGPPQVDFLSHLADARVYSVLVVGHESGRRNWRTAPTTESGFLEAKALRSNKQRAGRKPAASDRGVIPASTGRKTLAQRPPGTNGLARAQWQVGLESPPVTQGRDNAFRKERGTRPNRPAEESSATSDA